MKKLSTPNDLQDFLDTELGWRIKEISALKTAVRKSADLSQNTVARAAIALLYAHWEGFVKKATSGYLTYVTNQGASYLELQSCFVVFGLKKKLNELTESKTSSVNIAAIDFIRDQLGNRANLKIDSAINTGANLSSSVFNNILLSVGIDPSPYEPRYHFIDESLLKRRNNIAHGERSDVLSGDWTHIADEVIIMLRYLKNDIENATALEAFKR